MSVSSQSGDHKVTNPPFQKRTGCAWRIVRLLSVLVIGLLSLALAGGVYQALAALADYRNYPPPGQLVDVGGYRLHIHCLGEGTPTVILEGGAGEASPMWGWIQPEVARTTRVCAYDRAGFGWSDNGSQPREAQHIIRELHILLNNAGIEPPYVLVGHSFHISLLTDPKHAAETGAAIQQLVEASRSK